MRKKTMRLLPHEDYQLKQLYLETRIPVDQFAQRPRALARFVACWNARSGRSDCADDLRHYMLTRRKCGKWVRFDDGDYRRLACPSDDALTPAEWAALEAAYIGLNKGRDNYAVDPSLRKTLAKMFTERTGRHIEPDLLYAAAMAKQKHGEWTRVTPEPDGGMGFKDIDEIVA